MATFEYAPDRLENRECFWRDRYHFFKSKGYTLRPRYHPNWEASWKFSADPFPDRFEDSIIQWKGALLDATQEGKGGKSVFIKRVDLRTHPHEVRIASRLGSPDSRNDGRNHCIPVLSVFSDDHDPWFQYIVMPVLRPFNKPTFTSFGELVDFVDQTLEGLVYIHEQHVTHRDCAAENILMDGSNLYKDGWHPMDHWRARDGGDLPPSRKRSEAEIEYYFIDFGLSAEFDPEQHERLVTGRCGRTQAPEQISGLPYDPFKLDVYYLGRVYQTKIVD
ncbi:kinase-like domain-containing protein [Chiua virens]|nr:kinase-like domain-containing protein [Chiua virens]